MKIYLVSKYLCKKTLMIVLLLTKLYCHLLLVYVRVLDLNRKYRWNLYAQFMDVNDVSGTCKSDER